MDGLLGMVRGLCCRQEEDVDISRPTQRSCREE